MVPTEGYALAVEHHLDQHVVVVGVEEVRAVMGAGLDIDVVKGQPDAPVDMLGDLGAAIGAEVEQHAVAQAIEAAQLRVLLQIVRRTDRVDDVMEQRRTAVALADLGHLGDEDVGTHARLHRQEVLGGDQVEIDSRVGAEEARQAVGQPERGKCRRAAQGQDPLAGVVAADAFGGLGDVDEGQLHRIVENRAGDGQFHGTARAGEQLGAEVAFQFANLPANGGLSDAQGLGGAREVLVFGRRHKGFDGT
ncbi:hypothetical protein D3C85_1158480 [compost metagenome]